MDGRADGAGVMYGRVSRSHVARRVWPEVNVCAVYDVWQLDDFTVKCLCINLICCGFLC